MDADLTTPEWYVLRDPNTAQDQAPISLRDIDALYKTGAIRSNTLVWKDGMDNWQPIYQIDTLKSLINDSIAEAEKMPEVSGSKIEPRDTTPSKEVEVHEQQTKNATRKY